MNMVAASTILTIITILTVMCGVFMWRDMGCEGWKLRHGGKEYEYAYDASHKTPQFDEDTGEAYANEFEVYKLRCQRCDNWSHLNRRFEEKNERRWEPDTVQEMMNDD